MQARTVTLSDTLTVLRRILRKLAVAPYQPRLGHIKPYTVTFNPPLKTPFIVVAPNCFEITMILGDTLHIHKLAFPDPITISVKGRFLEFEWTDTHRDTCVISPQFCASQAIIQLAHLALPGVIDTAISYDNLPGWLYEFLALVKMARHIGFTDTEPAKGYSEYHTVLYQTGERNLLLKGITVDSRLKTTVWAVDTAGRQHAVYRSGTPGRPRTTEVSTISRLLKHIENYTNTFSEAIRVSYLALHTLFGSY